MAKFIRNYIYSNQKDSCSFKIATEPEVLTKQNFDFITQRKIKYKSVLIVSAFAKLNTKPILYA